jgi:formylglycine-generating enzyme required for sulfatase activity
MKLKYTIPLLSLARPLAAETNCLQYETPYEIISCLNQRVIDNSKALRRDIQQLRQENQQLKSELAKLKKDISVPEVFRDKLKFVPEVFRDSLKDGSLGPEMVRIPAGSFRMGNIQGGGDSDEQPVHSVYVNQFAIGKFEVTFAEYDKFAEATGRSKPDDQGWGRGNYPVINVSWHDATAYAKWLSDQTGYTYRLPTEAEWEYAARAGTETKYWWGNVFDLSKANYGRTNIGKTSPVGNYKANKFGLYDTSGNVLEWTCSEYTYKYNNKKKACINENSNKDRVIRGGSWYGTLTSYLRAAHRSKYGPDYRNFHLGFRLVVLRAAWIK